MAEKVITQIPTKQCQVCNIGFLRSYDENFYKCDWCSSAVLKAVKK